jgi:hypothetical protein
MYVRLLYEYSHSKLLLVAFGIPSLWDKNAALAREIGSKFPQAGYKCEYMLEDLLLLSR